jgi:hypothetical protein
VTKDVEHCHQLFLTVYNVITAGEVEDFVEKEVSVVINDDFLTVYSIFFICEGGLR